MPETNSGGLPAPERRALATGTRVQEFEILRLIGGGGFGLVYLARDISLGRHVALKEYMPPLAARLQGGAQVTAHFLQDVEVFKAGLHRFLNEARLLARFDHPALVKVHRVWEENGTAYIAMPYYEGPTLQKAVAEKSVPSDEDSLRQILRPLLDALAALHREQCYHRDISPDNILITANGPVLLDFGAARQTVGTGAQNFTVVLKQGYAPLEQYATEGTLSMRQGPWTDIYALSAVMRYAVTGSKPASAVARAARRPDPLAPLAKIARGRYSDAFLRALDVGMSLYVEDRPQTIAEFRARLGGPDARTLTGVTGIAAAPQPVPAQLAALRQSFSRAMAGSWPRRLAVVIAPVILLGAAVAIAVHLSHGEPHKTWSSPTLIDNDGGDGLTTGTPPVPPTGADGSAGSSSSSPMPPVTKTPKQPARRPLGGPRPPPTREREPPLPPPAVPVVVVDPAAIKTVSPPSPESSNPGVQSEGDVNRLGDAPLSAAPVADVQPSPIEIQYTRTVDRVIKTHSMIPDSPEFEAALLKSKGRETVVSFELNRQGKVSQVTVDRPSGSPLLDKTAMRIVSSMQYPPFPVDGWQGKSSHVFSVALKFQK